MISDYRCPECGRHYSYELVQCSWCRLPLEPVTASDASVIAVTEVHVPSVGHEDVPYWCALAMMGGGLSVLVKLDHAVLAGSVMSMNEDTAAVELAVVGVLGTGVMGRGLVELLLSRGHRVVWCGRSATRIEAASTRLFERLGRVMDEDEIAAARTRLVASTELKHLGACDLVVEAVAEQLDPKKQVLAEAERFMRDDAVLATNTSGLSLDDLADALAKPERFGALHFFNPPTRMRLVETALCSRTSEATSEFLDAFSLSLGKTPVRVSATPAFAVNRALMPLLNEAVRELEEGVASAESIDEAIRLGLNHPMGPLALADLIGLDVVVDIMENLAERTGDDSYAPRRLLVSLVAGGCLGRKTGSGFYEYRPSA